MSCSFLAQALRLALVASTIFPKGGCVGVMGQAIISAPLALGCRIHLLPWALPKASDAAPLVLILKCEGY
ncbi:MAG: hypothetical protein JJU34_14540 [Lunatimonas sp.]|uniref:hypothetical protein n=1 Tax=Lunatimonas sp. TaxID=2060141 RepID=UPI00263B8C63|nr:hypothetical protein [Lunatimonas sp.]MCC5938494.1 hypothetical protein [Lunatimonas sp.]